jgi:2-hydroxy-3-oxopropionate reductase
MQHQINYDELTIDKRRAVGIIGLGNMGSRFAANLIKDGFQTVIYDIKNENAEKIASQKIGSVKVAHSNAEVARLSDVIFTILPTSESAKVAALDEKSGLLAGLGQGKTFVEMSSIDSKSMKLISNAIQEKSDCDIIDATISGVEEDVEARRMVVMLAGNKRVIENRINPILRQVTSGTVFVAERLGAAKDLKTSTAMISAIQMTGVAEVLAWLAKRDVSPNALVELMEKTSTNLHNITDITQRLLKGKFKERASWMPKDVGFGLREAEDSGVPLPLTAAVQQIFMIAKSNNLAGYEAPGIIRKAYELISDVQISENE